jgi:phosphoribosylaminoimidazole-succinocarboxamide synthase
VFPIEFVVRGYMTGSTSTSLWTHYNGGGRDYCGNVLEDGMVKNMKLPANIITPTTKEKEHDRPISLTDIVGEGWMQQEDLDYCVAKTLEVFAFAQVGEAFQNL